MTVKIAWDYDPSAMSGVAKFMVYKIDSKTGSPTYGQRIATLAQSTSLPTDAAPLSITADYGMNQVEVTAVDQSGGESAPLAGNFSLTLPAPTNFRKIG